MGLRVYTGHATRLAMREHLATFVAVHAVLIFVALMIDFAENFDSIRAAADGGRLIPVLGKYVLYRVTDITTRLMPVSALLGAFLAEIRRRALLETVILAASGVSALPTIAALCWIGFITGGLQWKLERDWRPAAIFALVDLRAGEYAGRYVPGLTEKQYWFVRDDSAIVGHVLVGPEPEMRNVSYFIGLNGQGFDRLIKAQSVKPMGDGMWRFEQAEIWTSAGGNRLVGKPSPELDMPLWITSERLQYLLPSPYFLPHDVLLARHVAQPDNAAVNTTIWRRYTAWFLPGLFAFLGASLAMTGFRGRVTRVPILVGMAFGGYLVSLSIKVFWALGELGAMSAPFAVLVPSLLALGIGATLQYILNREAHGRRLPLG
ncbi:MAG: LptF/LptG family permease [Pseudooceanicola sp.]